MEIAPILGAAATIGVAFVGGFVGFARSVGAKLDASNAASEARAVVTHQRIDDVRKHIDDKCVSKEVYAADLRRIDDALVERDRIHQELSNRLNCPAARGEP